RAGAQAYPCCGPQGRGNRRYTAGPDAEFRPLGDLSPPRFHREPGLLADSDRGPRGVRVLPLQGAAAVRAAVYPYGKSLRSMTGRGPRGPLIAGPSRPLPDYMHNPEPLEKDQ